jgi:hypothetical protein
MSICGASSNQEKCKSRVGIGQNRKMQNGKKERRDPPTKPLSNLPKPAIIPHQKGGITVLASGMDVFLYPQ